MDTKVSKVKFLNTLGVKRTEINRIPLLITNHPLHKHFKVIDKYLHLLYMNNVKKGFNSGAMVPVRGSWKLNSFW